MRWAGRSAFRRVGVRAVLALGCEGLMVIFLVGLLVFVIAIGMIAQIAGGERVGTDVVQTADGREFRGLIVEETEARVRVVGEDGVETEIPRAAVVSVSRARREGP